jgi:hypothetical protein
LHVKLFQFRKVFKDLPKVKPLRKLKLDEKKSKHINLTFKNGFGPTFLHSLLRRVKGTKSLTFVREVRNKYDLTTIPYFYWPIIMISSSGLLLVVSHLLQSQF